MHEVTLLYFMFVVQPLGGAVVRMLDTESESPRFKAACAQDNFNKINLRNHRKQVLNFLQRWGR